MAQGARLRVYNKTFSLLKSEIPNPKSNKVSGCFLQKGERLRTKGANKDNIIIKPCALGHTPCALVFSIYFLT
jgi:hypothetical protein